MHAQGTHQGRARGLGRGFASASLAFAALLAVGSASAQRASSEASALADGLIQEALPKGAPPGDGRALFAAVLDSDAFLHAEVGPFRVYVKGGKSSAAGVLEPGDILLSVDGTEVYDDGTVQTRKGERALFTSLLDRRQIGEPAALRFLRAGKELRRSMTLKGDASLVPGPLYGVRPTYYVFAGLIFTPLTRNYLATYTDYRDAPTSSMNSPTS